MTNDHTLSCLVYSSQGTSLLTEKKLEQIVQLSVERNEKLGVTGVLLFDGNDFIQYLEGPKQHLVTLYDSIERNSLHCNLKIMHQSAIRERHFAVWFMGLVRPTQSELLNIMNWDWWDAINDHPLAESDNQGVTLLEQFCHQLGFEPLGTLEY